MRSGFEEKIDEAKTELAEQQEQLGALVEEETRRRFRERKREGALFAAGLVLQLAGAGVLLSVC